MLRPESPGANAMHHVYDSTDEALIATWQSKRICKPRVRQALLEGIRNGLTLAEVNADLAKCGESISVMAFQALVVEARRPLKGPATARGSPIDSSAQTSNNIMSSPIQPKPAKPRMSRAAIVWDCAMNRKPLPNFNDLETDE
jgi:hypothetical protein